MNDAIAAWIEEAQALSRTMPPLRGIQFRLWTELPRRNSLATELGLTPDGPDGGGRSDVTQHKAPEHGRTEVQKQPSQKCISDRLLHEGLNLENGIVPEAQTNPYGTVKASMPSFG